MMGLGAILEMDYSKPYKIVGRVGRSSLRKVMKVKTAFIIFAILVCDAYAYFYSQYQNGPKFQLFWPENKRDNGVLACRKWLEAKISAERK